MYSLLRNPPQSPIPSGATPHILKIATSPPPHQAFWKGGHQANTRSLKSCRGVRLTKHAEKSKSPFQAVATSWSPRLCPILAPPLLPVIPVHWHPAQVGAADPTKGR